MIAVVMKYHNENQIIVTKRGWKPTINLITILKRFSPVLIQNNEPVLVESVIHPFSILRLKLSYSVKSVVIKIPNFSLQFLLFLIYNFETMVDLDLDTFL